MIKLKDILEGTCGYGIDGELGDEPAGPHLLKKKKKNESRNKSLGEKDLMKYLMKRFKFSKKKAIGTMKKAGFDTSMLKEIVEGNTCIHCGNIVDENLKKWFSDKWVNIGKKKKGGGHPPCGSSGKKRGYAKCVPKSKAANMSKKQKSSATRRKRAAQNKAGRGGTSSLSGGGKKPIRVSTKPKNRKVL